MSKLELSPFLSIFSTLSFYLCNFVSFFDVILHHQPLHQKEKKRDLFINLMAFSSINPNSFYLDPTSWQVEHNQQTTEARGTSDSSHQFLSSPLQPPQAGGGCSTGDAINYSFRSSGSMTERARLAKVPLPEPGLKCPRCDSTNTKFCYFNNYNLSQPRHFCKACRRYWTRGGALRNVPVGGGCRRNNKRNKGSSTHKRSKSPLAAHEQSSFSGGGTDNMLSQIPTGAPALQLLPPLNHLGEYNSMEREPSLLGGLHVPASSMAGFHQVLAAGSSNSSGFLEQFRSLQQQLHHPFPFLTSFGLAPPPSTTAVYSFEGDGAQAGSYGGPVRFKAVEEAGPVAIMKTGEENNLPAGVNTSKNMREISGAAAGNEQIWCGNRNNNIINAWTDLSGFSNTNDH